MGASDKDVMTAISVEEDADEQQEKSETGYLGDMSHISPYSETWKKSFCAVRTFREMMGK